MDSSPFKRNDRSSLRKPVTTGLFYMHSPDWHTSTQSPPNSMHLFYLGGGNWILKQIIMGSNLLDMQELEAKSPISIYHVFLENDLWLPYKDGMRAIPAHSCACTPEPGDESSIWCWCLHLHTRMRVYCQHTCVSAGTAGLQVFPCAHMPSNEL
ncbi:hypothetical protein BDV93DRAFT_555929 [Ceratobasidium sp. AG-I]|nr:hypothetical protein BDV93DRAFT_555929 [Ceratobasidium sp. AG-I]